MITLWAGSILAVTRAEAWTKAEAKVEAQQQQQIDKAPVPPCTPGRDGCWTGGLGMSSSDGWPSSDWQSSDWQTSSYMGDA